MFCRLAGETDTNNTVETPLYQSSKMVNGLPTYPFPKTHTARRNFFLFYTSLPLYCFTLKFKRDYISFFFITVFTTLISSATRFEEFFMLRSLHVSLSQSSYCVFHISVIKPFERFGYCIQLLTIPCNYTSTRFNNQKPP